VAVKACFPVNRIPSRPVLLALAGTALLTLVAMAVRPLAPVDETRYAAVAWEMWLRGDFIVPYLNGEPYSHKPPLLFWLMQAGWAVFGVSETWLRVLPALIAAASLGLTHALARRLWPQQAPVAGLAVLFLAGSLMWALWSTALMFDILLALPVMAALLAVLRQARGGDWRGWAGFALAVAAGVLAKGPVTLLYLGATVALAPWWAPAAQMPARDAMRHWLRWYLVAGLASAAGLLLAAGWAVPAVLRGGPGYADALLWNQGAGRVVDSFAHGRPWWWYLPVLWLAVFPWSAWPALAGATRRALSGPADPGLRVCVAWFLPAFVALSLISGKQPHYLMPLLPALALGLARLVHADGAGRAGRRDLWWPAVLVAAPLLGGAIWWHSGAGARHAPWLEDAPLWSVGLALALAAIAAARASRLELARRVEVLYALSLAMLVALHLALLPAWRPSLDLHEPARRVAILQASGVPVAWAGSYAGQLQFLGRLRAPLPEIDPRAVQAFFDNHPGGVVVVTTEEALPPDWEAVYGQYYRGRHRLWLVRARTGARDQVAARARATAPASVPAPLSRTRAASARTMRETSPGPS